MTRTRLAKKPEVSEPSDNEQEQILYEKDSFLLIYEKNEKDCLAIARPLNPVTENLHEVEAIYYSRDGAHDFKIEAQEFLRTKFIIQEIHDSDFKVETTTKGRGKKKTEVVVKILFKTASVKKLVNACKKFAVPTDSEDESHSEGEEEVNFDDATSVKSDKSSKKRSSKVGKIVGAKSKDGAKKASKKVKERMDSDGEPEENEIEATHIAFKMKDGTIKRIKKPKVFSKGKWNPSVEIVDTCQQLEGASSEPDFSGSSWNNNRELIRAAKTNNKALFNKILKSKKKISTLSPVWGIENTYSVNNALIDNNNYDCYVELLKKVHDTKDVFEYAKNNAVSINQADTGFNDKYAYGVATRAVNMSRGGAQGTNALIEDRGVNAAAFNAFDFLSSEHTTPQQIDKIISFFPTYEHQIFNAIPTLFIKGNRKILGHLFKKAFSRGPESYGTNEFYHEALLANSPDALKNIKKLSCTKKSFAFRNISPIHCACLNPNPKILEFLFSVNPEYMNQDMSMRTPVHFAACCESPKVLEYLISIKCDTRMKDNMRKTPLMYACESGRLENVKLLMNDNNSVLTDKTRDGYHPLHFAAENGHIEVVKYLISNGINVKMTGPKRMTALHIAAYKGDYEMAKFLRENGASVLLKDKFKRTPLMLAAKNGNLKVASYLLQYGSLYDLGDSSGNTSLHYACAYGYPEMIDLLFKAGADPNVKNSWNLTPVTVALLKSYSKCLFKMLDHPNVDVNCIDNQGRTLVSNTINVINKQNLKTVRYLLVDKKADPNIPDAQGLIPFDYLCKVTADKLAKAEITPKMNLKEIKEIKNEKIQLIDDLVKLFLESGTDVNHQDQEGNTPLFTALQSKNIQIIKKLLNTPDVNFAHVASKTKSTVFHFFKYIQFEEEFKDVATEILKKVGSPQLLAKYNSEGYTVFLSMIEEYQKEKPYWFSRLKEELNKEARIKALGSKGQLLAQEAESQGYDEFEEYEEDEEEEEEESEEDSRRNKAMIGGMGKAAKGFGGDVNHGGAIISQNEMEKIDAQAEKIQHKITKSIFEILKNIKLYGGEVNYQKKEPYKQPKKEGEGEEDEDETIMDLDEWIESHLDKFLKKMKQDIQESTGMKVAKKLPQKTTGWSMVHYACQSADIELLKFLIEDLGVKLNQKSVYEVNELSTFIEESSEKSGTEIIDFLIREGVEFNHADIYGKSALITACKKQKMKFVKGLLEHHAQVDHQDSNGSYALIEAIKHKNFPMIELLIDHKADPNLADKKKRTAMHWAINMTSAGSDATNEIENLVISAGANLNAIDVRGRTPLHYAFIKIGRAKETSQIDPIETVSNILSREGVNVNVRDNWGNIPLNYAAQRGSMISGLYLLKKETNVNNLNNQENSPLNLALLNNHQNMAIFLIQKGADLSLPVKNPAFQPSKKMDEEKPPGEIDSEEEPNQDDEDENNNFRYKGGFGARKKRATKRAKRSRKAQNAEKEDPQFESSASELEPEDDEEEEEQTQNRNQFGGFGFNQPFFGGRKARRFGHHGFGQQETEETNDFRFKKKEAQVSTFSLTIKRNWQSVAYLMLEYGYNLSLAVLDSFQNNKFNYVYTLLLKNAEAQVYQMKNEQGQNLTHLFSKYSSQILKTQELFNKILKKLESKNLDFKSVDSSGKNSLHYACECACIELIEKLLQKGLDLNCEDSDGLTPLGHLAIKHKDSLPKFIEICKAHSNSNFDINQRFKVDGKYHTLLTYLTTKKTPMLLINQLIAAGADHNKGDEDGWTPLVHMIRMNRYQEIVNYVGSGNCNTHNIDRFGQTLIHHVVRPKTFGSYENKALLKFLANHADINKEDGQGHPPIYYAKGQQTGAMLETLKSLGAKDTSDGAQGVLRSITTQLSGFSFPESKFDFEEDFEKFIDKCEEEEKKKMVRREETTPFEVDSHMRNNNYEVCFDGEDAYSCLMVKVDIQRGFYSGNVFYKMQIVREKLRGIYVVFTRWGRVGESGQYQQTPFSTLDEAVKEFSSIFKSKTGNLWENRHNFEKVDKKYRLLPFKKQVEVTNYLKVIHYKDPSLPQTALQKPVLNFIRRISNYKVISTVMRDYLHIDEKYLSLKDLTKERILEAKAVIEKLTKVLKQYEKKRTSKDFSQTEDITDLAEELSKLTSEFYELLPSNRYKSTIPPITNQYELNDITRTVHSLLHLESALKMIGAATYRIPAVHPADYVFGAIGAKIDLVPTQSEEYSVIKEYIRVGLTSGQKMKNLISQVFAVERPQEKESFEKWKSHGNSKLLWHGTRSENLVSILQSGLRIAPPDSQRTGSMFGSGIYFAEMFGKSFSYCQSEQISQSSKPAKLYILLCEVALGKSKNLIESDPNISGIPNDKFQSVKGVGRNILDPEGKLYMTNGCVVPLGESIQTNDPKVLKNYGALNYNEYIVYCEAQVKIRYVVECRQDNSGYY